MDRMGNAKKLVFKIMWEDIRMTGKNKEGYPDPTASKAIQAADHMPEHTYNYKCLSQKEINAGYYFKFNEKAILRTDSKTQKEVVTGYVQNGLYTINEGRDALDLPKVEGGDVNMVNGTYQPITHIGAAYGINQGGEGSGD